MCSSGRVKSRGHGILFIIVIANVMAELIIIMQILVRKTINSLEWEPEV